MDRNGIPESYLANLNIIEQVFTIQYGFAKTRVEEGDLRVAFAFREDSSVVIFGFDSKNYCSDDHHKTLCAWEGDKNTFEINYDPSNLAYNEIVGKILDNLFRQLDTGVLYILFSKI